MDGQQRLVTNCLIYAALSLLLARAAESTQQSTSTAYTSKCDELRARFQPASLCPIIKLLEPQKETFQEILNHLFEPG